MRPCYILSIPIEAAGSERLAMHFLPVFILALVLPMLVSGGPDARFRVYEPAHLLGYKYPHRTGAAGFVPGVDFITVGKLDGNPLGPFAGMDESEITRRFAFLRKADPESEVGFIDWIFHFGETYSQEQYEFVISWIMGDSRTPLYMKDVLKAQIAAETPHLKDMLESQIAFLEGAGKPLDVVVEVANEPNAFPYIPADLFAWYYGRWWGLVKKEMNAINSDRISSNRPAAAWKVMPGGLWSWEGMPLAILQTIDKGFFVKFNGIQLSARIETSTQKYYTDFLNAFKSLSFCDIRKPSSTSGLVKITRVCVEEDLEPVIVTSWAYRNINGQMLSSKPTTPGVYFEWPKTWTYRPLTEMISIGNIHLYPYLGIHSSQNLPSQLNSLSGMVSTMAANAGTGRVWITELGNFNPWFESRVVSDLMDPLFTELTSPRFGKIDRWYWFKNGGSDHKFDMLDDFPARPGFEIKLFAYKVVNVVFDFIPGYDIPSIPTEAATQAYDMLSAMSSHNPPQGLTLEEEPRTPSVMGRSYAKWAKANVVAGFPGIMGLLLQ